MTDDVMSRLMSIEPLPRGERMVRIFDSLDTSDNISHYPGRCYLEASHLGVLDDLFLIDGNTSLAVRFTREWAAPLRRCREQRQRLREENRRLREEVADTLAGADADAFILTQAGRDIDKLREENAILRAALEEYGDHTPNCPNRIFYGPCDCGWDEVRP